MFIGQIALWSGTVGNIPAGWQLCNGLGGTPNLEQRFVRGSHGSYAIGDLGGSENHSHAFTSDGHSHTLEPGTQTYFGEKLSLISDVETDTGITDPTDNLPSWYTLAFIMRMS